jgi:protein involved in polysaccharide export with SLBB domain
MLKRPDGTMRDGAETRRGFLGRALVAAAILPIAAACDTLDPTLQPATSVPPPEPELRLAAGDKLRITVFGEDKLTGDYQVDAGGSVSMPLAGTVPAAGLTKLELERRLSGKLSGGYLKNPKVTVEITSSRPFYILGEVERPGEYPYRAGLNIVSAVAIAGGNTYRASRSKVYIQRSGAGSFEEVPMGPNVPIYPGDVIKVPERYF